MRKSEGVTVSIAHHVGEVILVHRLQCEAGIAIYIGLHYRTVSFAAG